MVTRAAGASGSCSVGWVNGGVVRRFWVGQGRGECGVRGGGVVVSLNLEVWAARWRRDGEGAAAADKVVQHFSASAARLTASNAWRDFRKTWCVSNNLEAVRRSSFRCLPLGVLRGRHKTEDLSSGLAMPLPCRRITGLLKNRITDPPIYRDLNSPHPAAVYRPLFPPRTLPGPSVAAATHDRSLARF